jgi:serine-type D-Ala-D-Ala endopeptidase (penicillin-binding protein 7)
MSKWILAAALMGVAAAQAAPAVAATPDAPRAQIERKLVLRSNAAMVVDQQTGQVLYGKNVTLQRPIASITKLMTAVVTLDAGMPLNEMMTVTRDDIDTLRHTGSRLPIGATLPRREMLLIALMASENRAASALARTYPGGLAACIAAMNRKARELGMWHTHYVEGTGLNNQNVSTAEDLAKLVNAASHYPLIHQITTTGAWHVNLPGRAGLDYRNTDPLVRDSHWDVGLSKTGFINEAGECLVMQAGIGHRKVIIVLLDSYGKYSRIGDAIRVRQWLEQNAAALG